MRKRAQLKMPQQSEKKEQISYVPERKKTIRKKNWWVAVSLVCIFFLVLLLNSYFNIISNVDINPDGTTVSDKFYLSGPDPYYNMRLVETTLETGKYPYYSYNDPILNYPLGKTGGRAPLMNMLAIGFSKLLYPFTNDADAIGYSMQFVPALFGALLVFPVYFIGKSLFGKKEGLIAALLVAVIPIHIGSGHGSAYALFDHDSLNLLLFFFTFLFLIKSIQDKNSTRSLLFAILSGISAAALSMIWVEARFLYTVIGLYAVVQILIDIITKKISFNFVRNMSVILFTGYLVSLPVIFTKSGQFEVDLTLILGGIVLLFGLFALALKKYKIPWVLSLPVIAVGSVSGLLVLYFINPIRESLPFLSPLSKISEVIYGTGIYGDKVSETIAEASTYSISRSVMSYGPGIYWIAWLGFVLLIILYLKTPSRKDYLFFVSIFFINIWLSSTAGRFLNDMVPVIAILAGWIIWFVVDKIDYKQMIRNIRNTGGGLRGVRKGFKIYHLLGIFFVVFLVMMPNTFLSLDAAIPAGVVTKNGTSSMKIDYMGYSDSDGAFGSGSYKEQYWVNALSWLSKQDANINDSTKRPAFISWWDYGFYESAVGKHPTVADNFQSGIPPAANFHTSIGEKEAIAVWVVRLMEGNLYHNGKITNNVKDVLLKYLGNSTTDDIIRWIENSRESPSYGAPIGEKYDPELSKQLTIGSQWDANAYYQDIVRVLNSTLDDESMTWLYHDMQATTGNSIRYYGVEGYDEQIFNIFGFLSDKSNLLSALQKSGGLTYYNPEDDFVQVKYVGYQVDASGNRGSDQAWTAQQLNEMAKDQLSRTVITSTTTQYKEAYNETMFYRTYIGNIPEGLKDQLKQLPCWEMRHFDAEFISELPYYNSGRSAVVIAKYYEGAILNGTVYFQGSPINENIVVRKNIKIFGNELLVDHDKTNSENGSFLLIAPAGEITLEIRRYPELGINAFAMKQVKFNSTSDPMLAAITDDESMRKSGTNYIRNLSITVEPGNLSGYIYENADSEDAFNMSIDQPLSDVDISLWEVAAIDQETGQPSDFGSYNEFTTGETGYYNFSNLMPGIYIFRATLDGVTIHENYIFVLEGDNSYNVSKTKTSSLEGTVFFDENGDQEYNVGEEMSGVDVELTYLQSDGQDKIIGSVTTDETGKYSFSPITTANNPLTYTITAKKPNPDTGYNDYYTEEQIQISENETKIYNLSIDYATIDVSGNTIYNMENIPNIEIEFTPDELIENNTAVSATATSNEEGTYDAALMPGSYNITVDTSVTEGIFGYSGKLTIQIGEGIKTYNIELIKKSITVSGTTTYEGVGIANISITFSPKADVENNTAEYGSTMSLESGIYSVELLNGSYDVYAEGYFNESGVDVSYTFTGELEVTSDQESITYNIALTREEQ